MDSFSAILHKIGFFIILVTIALIPVFFLTLTPDFYEFNKYSLLFLSSLILLITWALTLVSDKQVHLLRTPFGLPILTIATAWLLSTFLKSPNRAEPFLDAGQTGTILALTFLYFSCTNLIRTKKQANLLSHFLIGSVSLLGLAGLIWGSGVTKLLSSSFPAFLKSPLWTPAGSPISAVIALISLVPFLVTILIKEKSLSIKTFLLSTALFITLAGAGTLTYRMFNPPAGISKPALLSQSVGWSIALEALKVSPLLGTGPSTFISDFTQFRPVSYNNTANWNLRFANSSNFYLQTLATTGVIGLIATLFLVIRVWRVTFKTFKLNLTLASAASVSALIISFIHLFIPASFLSLSLLFVYLILTISSLRQHENPLVQETNIDIVATSGPASNFPLLPWIGFVLAIGIALPSLYLGWRAYAAEVFFQKAITAISKNDGKLAYDTLLSTIKTNPYRDSYRVTYSQTNLLLANSLASNKDLSDADRAVVTQLVQQSIREAKNAVALNPLKSSNVENLANIYQNLLNFAQGADAWTIASYRQAILLDPINPNLRIALGGTLFSQKNYDDAIRMFQAAIDLKPDLANGYYNLASAYRQKEDFPRALAAMQSVVQLVDKSSPDYEKAKSELNELQQKVPSASPAPTTSTAPSQLSQPQPLPSPKVNPPLKLDESLSPQSPATPSSTP